MQGVKNSAAHTYNMIPEGEFFLMDGNIKCLSNLIFGTLVISVKNNLFSICSAVSLGT